MQKILDRLPRIARSNASVLLRGESGTGKEILADAIHALSPRVGGPLVKINCGALPETLLESALFGHVKGSFTGAVADRQGLFEAANTGTIFLDEIGEVSPALQVKLLRVLQQGEFQPVGETRTRKTDVRVIAATNRDLEALMREGAFRQDLFYRLNVVPIFLPPLRERPEDIPALIEHFSRRFHPEGPVNFSAEARQALLDYEWPGNIRELENAIEHALVLGNPDDIQLEDLPVSLQDFRAKQIHAAGPDAVGDATLEDIERRCLLAALRKTDFNRTRAAHLLGITRRTLGYRIQKYNLDKEIQRESTPESHTET
jgi:transcriptional regulator with PAS, ATPase and Fis domain